MMVMVVRMGTRMRMVVAMTLVTIARSARERSSADCEGDDGKDDASGEVRGTHTVCAFMIGRFKLRIIHALCATIKRACGGSVQCRARLAR